MRQELYGPLGSTNGCKTRVFKEKKRQGFQIQTWYLHQHGNVLYCIILVVNVPDSTNGPLRIVTPRCWYSWPSVSWILNTDQRCISDFSIPQWMLKNLPKVMDQYRIASQTNKSGSFYSCWRTYQQSNIWRKDRRMKQTCMVQNLIIRIHRHAGHLDRT